MSNRLADQRKAETLVRLIDAIERRELDQVQQVESTPGDAQRTPVEWLRVRSLSRFWKGEGKVEFERFMMEDVLAGLYGLKLPFAYFLLGSRTQFGVYAGYRASPTAGLAEAAGCLTASLRSTYPHIDLTQSGANSAEAERVRDQIVRARHFGLLTGIPTRKVGTEEFGVEQIERLARGLRGEEWGYLVVAEPIREPVVLEAVDYLLEELRAWHSEVKISEQQPVGVNQQATVEKVDRLAQYYLELLEVSLEKAQLAKAAGMWWTGAYFFASEEAVFQRLKGLLLSVFSGEESVPDPVRALEFADSDAASELVLRADFPAEARAVLPEGMPESLGAYRFLTPLNTRDLATLTHFPKEEMPGYNVIDFARFGVCVAEEAGDTDALSLGRVVDRGVETEVEFGLPAADITRHALVVGVTGSGKTNTSMALLDQLDQRGIPFLVIEPAKSEYRRLSETGRFRDRLQVFTLGDETRSPFRLNPFEILPGTSVQSHLDNLKASFNASISMWAPLPTVLERCLHEVYVDRGWDLALNRNRWCDEADAVCPAELFPTLSDLYEKVDEVVDALGYEQKVNMDVKAALKTRLNGLRVGGKGLMLDTHVSIPMQDLLGRPTVLELKAMGDDDEKAFVMGLLLMRIYEFREALALREGEQVAPHVTLIEEAHRLLSNVPMNKADSESANARGKAVETFCNVLSEMRAYGEAFVIAEQIPVKLAPDAIKNTNLKIVHRLVSEEDREAIGGSMRLSEDQTSTLALLGRGKAVMFCEGLDEAVLVQVPNVKDELESAEPPARRSPRQSAVLADEVLRQTLAGCRHCREVCRHRSTTRDLLLRQDLGSLLGQTVLSLVKTPEKAAQALARFGEAALGQSARRPGPDWVGDGAGWCILSHAADPFFWRKLREYRLDYASMASVRDRFLQAVAAATQGNLQEVAGFARGYAALLEREDGPFDACALCGEKCLYRFEALRASEGKPGKRISAALNQRDDSIRRRTLEASLAAAAQLVPGADPSRLQWCAFCVFLHKVDALGFNVLLMAQEYLKEAQTMSAKPASAGGGEKL